MKNLKKIAATFVLVVLCISAAIAHGSEENMRGPGFMYNHDRSLEIAYEFEATLPTNRLGEPVYPDYFAGKYIDSDGNLVFMIVPSLTASSMAFDSFAHDFATRDGVIIRYVEHTYATLHEIFNRIIDFHDNTPGGHDFMLSLGVTGYGITTTENVITIRMEYNPRNVQLFRETVIDSPLVRFAQTGIVRGDVDWSRATIGYEDYTDTLRRGPDNTAGISIIAALVVFFIARRVQR